MQKAVVSGQPSWRVSSDSADVYVTELGGHVGPITHPLPSGEARPYLVAPWAEEQVSTDTPPFVRVLRGDFFCLPFGVSDAPFRDEIYPMHGETANERWKLTAHQESKEGSRLVLDLETRVWSGHVTKTVEVRQGHRAVYQSHLLRGFEGPMCFGTHPMLKFPDKLNSGLLSLSAYTAGQVYPGEFEEPANKGYSYLKPGATFDSLAAVPMANGGTSDLTRFPSHTGFDDLVMVQSEPNAKRAWSAVVFPERGYVWFSIKDPRVLGGTVLWLSNGGRHYAPWNGRHIGVLGIEEVTAYYGFGNLVSSESNPLSQKGFQTCRDLKDQTLDVRTAMGVHPVERSYGHVTHIEPVDGGVEIAFATGQKVLAPLDWHYVWRD